MNQFNSIKIKKDETTRNDINHRLQDFNQNVFLQGNNTAYSNDNLLGNQNPKRTIDDSSDKSKFQDQINNRIDTFSRNLEIGQRQLPFHNNIRDYNITVDSKKDEFNNRLSNYNYLSSNIPPQIQNQNGNQFNQISFHKNFRDDTNKRLEDLSPLSRNMGLPSNGTEPPPVPDFNQNLPQDNMDSTYSNYDYEKQFVKPEESQKEQSSYIKNYQSMNPYEDTQNIKYNSYDSCNFGAYIPDSSQTNYASSENKIYSQSNKSQDKIKNFDYSLIDNKPNNVKPVDNINKLPKLAYHTNMPVDTRQEFHFHQNFN